MSGPIRPQFSEGVVLVCRKCEGNDAFDLRHELKHALKEQGVGKRMKVVRVGCLDVCPKERTTAVVASFHQAGACFVVGKDDREAFIQQVVSGAAKEPGSG